MTTADQLIESLKEMVLHKARLASAHAISNQRMVSLVTLAENNQDVSLYDDSTRRTYALDSTDVKALVTNGYDGFCRSVREQMNRAQEPLVAAVRMDPSGAISALLKLASAEADYPEPIRTAAVDFLVETLGEKAIDEVTAALSSANEFVRYRAVLVLMFIQSVKTITPLISALKDADPDVRFLAATALGKKRATEAIEPLKILAVSDPAERARSAASTALRELGVASMSVTHSVPVSPATTPAKRWWQFWK